MIKRVTIYGDSFADPCWADPFRWQEITWYGLLRKRWPTIINLAKSGSGPMYSFKHFYQNLKSYNNQDLIIFVLSGQQRIYFDIEEAKDWRLGGYSEHQWNESICSKAADDPFPPIEDTDPKCQKWIENNEDQARFAIKTFSDELIYGNWKYESLLYTTSRIQKCKIFVWFMLPDESYIKTSLNNEDFHVHDEGLERVSWNEYVEEEKLIHKASDDLNYRVNLLSEVNHEIMYKQVTGFVDGNEIPKFLKNVYKGTYKKDEFVYD